jgi:uncharacterized membrane protein
MSAMMEQFFARYLAWYKANQIWRMVVAAVVASMGASLAKPLLGDHVPGFIIFALIYFLVLFAISIILKRRASPIDLVQANAQRQAEQAAGAEEDGNPPSA